MFQRVAKHILAHPLLSTEQIEPSRLWNRGEGNMAEEAVVTPGTEQQEAMPQPTRRTFLTRTGQTGLALLQGESQGRH